MNLFRPCPGCKGQKIQYEPIDAKSPLVPVPCYCCSGTGLVFANRVCDKCKSWKSTCKCRKVSDYEMKMMEKDMQIEDRLNR